VGVNANLPLGFDVDQNRVTYGYQWTVTRADADSMKDSVLKQEIFSVLRLDFADGSFGYIVKDKDNPKGASGKNIKGVGWKKAVEKWKDKDDRGLKLLTIDLTKAGKEMEGKPKKIMEVNQGTALDGKRFTSDDFPAYEFLGDEVGVTMYYTFRVTSELKNGKTITAIFQIEVAVEKVGGTWKKKTAKTLPKLPETFDK